MNNEEAIKRIQNHIEVHRIGKYPHIHLGEALNMAISALRFQQTMEKTLQQLSLDELVTMGSTPVWIVEGTDGGHWELSEDGLDYLEDREPALYGVSWWAYRQKMDG